MQLNQAAAATGCSPPAASPAPPKDSRSWSSCSLDRLVEMISGFIALSGSMTRSVTAFWVSMNSAEVPSVIFERVASMNLSSMP